MGADAVQCGEGRHPEGATCDKSRSSSHLPLSQHDCHTPIGPSGARYQRVTLRPPGRNRVPCRVANPPEMGHYGRLRSVGRQGGAVGSQLRQVRTQRGWTQARLIAALRQSAAQQGAQLPGQTSLRIMVSRWENDHVQPDCTYRGYLRQALGCTDEELGWMPETEPGPGALTAWQAQPERITPELVAFFRDNLDSHIQADLRWGSGPVLALAASQAQTVESLLAYARGPQRAELLRLASMSAEFYAWLLQDSRRYTQAQHWAGRALSYAQEMDNPYQIAYVLTRKSSIASDAGQAGTAVEMAQQALRYQLPLSMRMRAVALRQAGIAYAKAGQGQQAISSLSQAWETISDAAPGDAPTAAELAQYCIPGHFSYCTPAYIASEVGTSWLALRKTSHALRLLQDAADHWGQPDRDLTMLLIRLSGAALAAGEREQAQLTLTRAQEQVRHTYSARAQVELARVQRRLAQEGEGSLQ